ncbi:cytochrome-c peroxidase [Spirosoma endbachense]|uniref:Cytochrome-c peroxidase n=1 Tax=Spirosoma endbachense TaxID=2666025 RepID=A0A6P1VXG9_9BACT|nr:cytochrome c peroxidase [Spirosoma endbachense]QHV96782.1 cytochrome-c peroxidase [Spirosoma endbachense]
MRIVKFCLAIALMIALVSAWKRPDEPMPTGPYVLQYPASFGGRFTIPANNPLTQEGVYLGRLLFYEPRLSKTNTISCGSCHQQNRAFTDGRALSIGVSGKPTSRNSMSLANLLWVRQFFWDGRAASLEDQARIPLAHTDEMGMAPEEAAKALQQTTFYPALFRRVFGSDTITDARISKAIAQFERTLISANSRYDQYQQGHYTLTEAEQNGLRLFSSAPVSKRSIRGGNCAHCHGGPKLYQELFHNNGLDQVAPDAGRQAITGLALDQGRFRVPTLRNIALTAPYMHDGRLATLEAVIDHYSDHIQSSPSLSRELMADSDKTTGFHFTSKEKSDLLAFLHLLTDSSFVTNPQFSDPYKLKPTAVKSHHSTN